MLKSTGDRIQELPNSAEVLELISCPVCMEIPIPPIYGCELGHLICQQCKPRLKMCPLCKSNFSLARQFAVESIIQSSYQFCKFKEEGCPTVLKGEAMSEHINQCQFKPLSTHCHLGRYTHCKFHKESVPLVKYLDHLKQEHMMLPNATQFSGIRYKSNVLSDAINSFWLGDYFTIDSKTFIVRQFLKKDLVYLSLGLIGEESVAKKYVAVVTIVSKIDKISSASWTFPVHSIMLREEDIIEKFCGVVPLSYIKGHCKSKPVQVVQGTKTKISFKVEYVIKDRESHVEDVINVYNNSKGGGKCNENVKNV